MVINKNEYDIKNLTIDNMPIKMDNLEDWYKLGYCFGIGQNEKIFIDWMLCDLEIIEKIQDAPKKFIQEFINGYEVRNINVNILSNNDIRIKYGLEKLYLKLGICLNPFAFIKDGYAWYPANLIQKREALDKPVEVYNFEVAEDNSYIVENVCVHNCQSFSIAGKRDKNDPRNSLYMEYVKYLNYFNPKAFIMENVIGILSKKTETNESVIDIIMSELIINYNCIICKLYASDFEVPQNRRRTIIIGIRKDLNIKPTEPPAILTKENRIPVKNIILSKDAVDKSYYLSDKAIQGIKNKKEKSKAEGKGFGAQFLDMDKPSYTIPARYWKDGYDALVKYSETEIRRLTILELKRIQSFPDDYILDGSKKDVIIQIGNAVACRFAYHLGIHIKGLLL